MLILLSSLADAIVAQALDAHPMEACGVIAGSAESNLPERVIPMHNSAQSTTFFCFDSQQQLQVWKEMDTRGEIPVVLYHSHTQSKAYPSREDVLYAAEPHAHYVIIPTDPAYGRDLRSFRIVDGVVTEEIVKIVDTYVNQSDGKATIALTNQ